MTISLILLLNLLWSYTVSAVSEGGTGTGGGAGEEETASFVDALPDCDEQGLLEDYTIPNPNSFTYPNSPYLNAFTWEYCQLANEIDREALEKIDEIYANEDQTSLEQLRDVGEYFCYGAFGPCGTEEETLFSRYVETCAEAKDTIDTKIEEQYKTLPVTDPYFQKNCRQLAQDKVNSYKQVSYIQIAKNQKKLLEKTNLDNLKKTREETEKMEDVKENLWAKLGKVIRSLEGFIPFIENGRWGFGSVSTNTPRDGMGG